MALDITTDLSNIKNMYETTLIAVPELSEQEYRAVVEKFEKIITDGEGEIINKEHWGQKKLAYPMKKKTHGFYAFMEFTAPGTLIEKLEREYGYDEKVIRYLTVKLDRHHADFNKKRREKGFGQKKENSDRKDLNKAKG